MHFFWYVPPPRSPSVANGALGEAAELEVCVTASRCGGRQYGAEERENPVFVSVQLRGAADFYVIAFNDVLGLHASVFRDFRDVAWKTEGFGPRALRYHFSCIYV